MSESKKNMVEDLKQGFKAIDDVAKSWKQLHGKGIYITERDIENVKNTLKNALVGALILGAFLEEKKEGGEKR
jgi:hypothetical protein